MKKTILLGVALLTNFSAQVMASTEVDYSNKAINCNVQYIANVHQDITPGDTGESGVYNTLSDHKSENFEKLPGRQFARNVFSDKLIKVMVFGNIYDNTDKSMAVSATIIDLASYRAVAISDTTIENNKNFTLKARLSDKTITQIKNEGQNPFSEWVKLSCQMVDSEA